jgi:hypothetical protein
VTPLLEGILSRVTRGMDNIQIEAGEVLRVVPNLAADAIGRAPAENDALEHSGPRVDVRLDVLASR